MLKEGDKAPSFKLLSSSGKKVALKDYSGKTIILYFYPKDDTPGCTREACDFRDSHSQYLKKGAVVVGISADSLNSHKKFTEKYSLPFPLLVDENHAVAEQYGVWVEKSMYGKKYFGIERSTFVIGPDGKIKKIFRKVKVDGHSEEILKLI